jgi:hypothetical protein
MAKPQMEYGLVCVKYTAPQSKFLGVTECTYIYQIIDDSSTSFTKEMKRLFKLSSMQKKSSLLQAKFNPMSLISPDDMLTIKSGLENKSLSNTSFHV